MTKWPIQDDYENDNDGVDANDTNKIITKKMMMIMTRKSKMNLTGCPIQDGSWQ